MDGTSYWSGELSKSSPYKNNSWGLVRIINPSFEITFDNAELDKSSESPRIVYEGTFSNNNIEKIISIEKNRLNLSGLFRAYALNKTLVPFHKDSKEVEGRFRPEYRNTACAFDYCTKTSYLCSCSKPIFKLSEIKEHLNDVKVSNPSDFSKQIAWALEVLKE